MIIYSKIQPTKILHIINRKRDTQPGRTDLVDTEQFLQCAVMRHPKGVTFRPHHHFEQVRRNDNWIAQESWCVISGLVGITLYDIDNSVIHTDVLEPGDISITLAGGHTYTFMADESLVYEYKTGPYYGVENDKKFI